VSFVDPEDVPLIVCLFLSCVSLWTGDGLLEERAAALAHLGRFRDSLCVYALVLLNAQLAEECCQRYRDAHPEIYRLLLQVYVLRCYFFAALRV
jgi:hypothetical protein